MKKIIFTTVVIATSLILWCGCKGEEGEEQPTTGSIYGVITDEVTGEPMRASGVELWSMTLYHDDEYGYGYGMDYYEYNSLITKTVTGNEGQYEFNNLNGGTYGLRVMVSGYEDEEYQIEVSAGRISRADMQLEKQTNSMTVRTLAVSNIAGNSATLNGSYSSYSYSPNECGFVYGTQSNPANGGTKVTLSPASSFNTTITNLSSGTYYVQAYAKNSIGTEYGETISFQVSGMPSVSTLAATNVTANSATLNAHVNYQGSPAFTERGFVYSSTFPNPTIDDNTSATTKRIVSGTSADFSANISGLTAEVTYSVRAYATNASGTVYGETVTFKPTAIVDYIILQADGIMVQKNDISAGANWNDAKSLCSASTVGGKTGWRLPTAGELLSLYNNQTIIGGFSNNSYYWSSTNTYSTNYYRTVNFSNGTENVSSYNTYYTNTYRVRAVRSLP